MPNFPGQEAFPLMAQTTAMVDAGTITTNKQTGIVRGGTATPDFNVVLRGLGKRIDEKPKRPYP